MSKERCFPFTEPYVLLAGVLSRIEDKLSDNENTEDDLFADLPISTVHLRRLFKFTFGLPLKSYIRSRRLAVSVETLLRSDRRILDIAVDCGYEHEQTYIRAFKKEYGLTPGECRHSGQQVKLTPPLHLFPEHHIDGNVVYGPHLVMIPSFRLIGQAHRIEIAEAVAAAPEAGRRFWANERHRILEPIEPEVYYGLTRTPHPSSSWTSYLTSMKVHDRAPIPEGFAGDTVPASLCVGFRYVGHHHYEELDERRAAALYTAIDRLLLDRQDKYELLENEFFFEKVDTNAYDGQYCEMEWVAPIQLKPS